MILCDPNFVKRQKTSVCPLYRRSLVRSIFTAVLTFQGIDDLVMHATWRVGVREGRGCWELVEFGLHRAYNFSEIWVSFASEILWALSLSHVEPILYQRQAFKFQFEPKGDSSFIQQQVINYNEYFGRCPHASRISGLACCWMWKSWFSSRFFSSTLPSK